MVDDKGKIIAVFVGKYLNQVDPKTCQINPETNRPIWNTGKFFAVNGIIKIAVAHQIPLNFSTLIDQLSSLYPQGKEFKKNIETFIIERLAGVYLNLNNSIIQAVVAKEHHVELDVLEIDRKIRAVATIAASESFIEAFSTFKRVSNILKDEPMDKGFSVNEALFENDAERNLFSTATSAISTSYETIEERLDSLFALKTPLDTFFDNVMVNAEDLAVRANRKALVGMIYQEIYTIADIKNITL